MGEIPSPEIVIVGPGKLGRSMATLLEQIGQRTRLVRRGEPIPAAQVTWLTVPDTEISKVAPLVPEGGVVLHASGASSTDALRPHVCVGSLHPLMTFPGPEVGIPHLQGIPAAVAGDLDAIKAARNLALQLGMVPFEVPGNRALYHAAAVIAGNFTTTLMDISASLLVAAGVKHPNPAALLAPLAKAAIENAARVGPVSALTGPVVRQDEEILTKHTEAITQNSPGHLSLYLALLQATRELSRRTIATKNSNSEEN